MPRKFTHEDLGEEEGQDSPVPPTVSPLSSSLSELGNEDIDIKGQAGTGQETLGDASAATDTLKRITTKEPESRNDEDASVTVHPAAGENGLGNLPPVAVPHAKHTEADGADARKSSEVESAVKDSSGEKTTDTVMGEASATEETEPTSSLLAEEIIKAVTAAGRVITAGGRVSTIFHWL